MNAQEIELQIPQPTAKPRSRKSTVFGRSPRDEDMIIPENSINNYVAPSTSSQSSRSRQVSESSTITPHMPNLSGMGGSMLDGPMRPQIVHEPKVRRKSSIFRKIRDKLRRGSLISSSTADSAQSAQSTASASSSGASLGIAGMLMQTHSGTSLINPDLADMLFKSAAMTTAPMSVTGDHGCQEFYSDLYQKQHSYPQGNYQPSSRKTSNQQGGMESDEGLVASTELASELKMAFNQYAKGVESIPAREVGYILRSLGQNPTEDEINNLICEAGCDWEGFLNADDFLSVALVSMQKQADRMDDVRAAFRAFDHNGDGTISKDELKEAMQRFGHSFTEDECDEMFVQADLNSDGLIDWGEFVAMMTPGDLAKCEQS